MRNSTIFGLFCIRQHLAVAY